MREIQKACVEGVGYHGPFSNTWPGIWHVHPSMAVCSEWVSYVCLYDINDDPRVSSRDLRRLKSRVYVCVERVGGVGGGYGPIGKRWQHGWGYVQCYVKIMWIPIFAHIAGGGGRWRDKGRRVGRMKNTPRHVNVYFSRPAVRSVINHPG